MKSLNDRIEIIDGFRGLAILAVVLFHYYTRSESVDALIVLSESNHLNWFSYGYYGVHLFFAVSGFVICQSLEKTARPGIFFKHRIIRLMPSMILCSTITYAIGYVAHPETDLTFFQKDSLLNFLPSWSFTPPEIWNFLLGRSDIGLLDSSYWSLWVEVIFYAVAGLLYFLDDQRFLSRWLFLAFIVTIVRVIISPQLQLVNNNLYQTGFYYTFSILNLNYWVFFSIGIFSFHVYMNQKVTRFQWILMTLLMLLELVILCDGLASKILFLLVILLFFLFVRRPNFISFLGTRMFVTLGLISYPLYLIHQNIGLILIYKISKIFTSDYLLLIIPLIVLSFIIAVSYTIYVYFERPVIRYLRSL